MKFNIFLLSIILNFGVQAQAQGQARFIKVDSAIIWVNTIGIENRKEGQPLIVFESGLGTPLDNWDKVLTKTSSLAPVVSYDRPGIGASREVDERPTIKNVADRLVRILKHIDLDPPFVLVGHSLGGVYVRGFANYYPKLIAGIIMIDPADFTETRMNRYDHYEVLEWDASRVDSLHQSFVNKRKSRSEKAPASIRREGEVLEELREDDFKELSDIVLPNIPVHILTGGRFDMPIQIRSEKYDELSLFRSKMKHRVGRWIDVVQGVDNGMLFYSSNAGHFLHYDEPELFIDSIRKMLEQIYSNKKDN